MTGTVFTILGWVLAVLLGEVAVSGIARIVIERVPALRRRAERDGELLVPWAGVPGLCACAALALLTVLAAVPVLAGALLAGALLAAAALPLASSLRRARRRGGAYYGLGVHLLMYARLALAILKRDFRLLARRRANEVPAGAAPPRADAPPRPDAPAQPAGTVREVPPLRDDPALGPLPEPAEVAAGLQAAAVEAPGPWAALASWIAGFEPEDDNQQSWFIAGAAAGFIALGEAFHAHAENIVSGVGLDPSYGSAVLDLGDAAAGASGHATHTNRRYHVIYGAVKEAVSNGLHLPHRARQWFGDPGAGTPQDGPSESAA